VVCPGTARRCGAVFGWLVIVLAMIVAAANHAPAEPAPTGLPSAEHLSSDNAVGYLRVLGEEALAEERYTEAIRLFSEILRHDWNDPRAFALLQDARARRRAALTRWESQGRRARVESRWSEAVRLFRRVVAEDSTRNDLRRAVAALEVREDVDRLVRSGLAKLVDEDFAGAQLDFEQAVVLAPEDTTATRYLEMASGRIAGSTSLADLQADSAVWTKYRNALLKFRDGDLIEARRLWSEILTVYPGNAHVRSNLEQIARRLGREPMATSE